MYRMVCTCQDQMRIPAINLREQSGGDEGERWWACSECGKPREHWLRSLGDVMLNFFRGGDLDGNAYTTSTLLDHQELMEGYRWSAEVIVSQKTGASARVWLSWDLLPAVLIQDQNGQEASTMSPLEQRRKDLGLSRAVVADEAGVSQAVLARIEKNSIRTTDLERERVTEALDRIEAAEVQPVNPR